MTRFQYGAHVHANGIRQHYLRYGGTGPTLLLIPGITSPAITWGFVAEILARDFDVHVLDVRGRGLSAAHPALDWSLDAQVADLTGFVEALGFSRFHLLGHSMGARIAIRYARNLPPGLDRLVLADPPVTGPGRRAYPMPLSWYVDSIRLAREGADWSAMRPFSPSWTEAQLRLRAEWLHTCDEAAVRRSYADFHDTDIHVDLPHLTAPTLLMAAGKGGVIGPDDLAEIAALNPGIEQLVVKEAGHMIPWDDLASFIRYATDFLAQETAT